MPLKEGRHRKMLPQGLEVCAFCGTGDKDEVIYGKFYSSKAFSVHHNCMFFASGLSQKGKVNTGIVGFLIPDIKKELIRGKLLNCVYCKRRGATIGCCKTICRKSFHLPCAIKNGSLHQFFGSFTSYCKNHKPEQAPLKIKEDELCCHICYTALSGDQLDDCLYSPCCQKNYFHKYCLQQYALSAGMYFFKCPLCNNTAEFIKEMKIYGIHIPDKDASWELEENAYQDLLLQRECDAPVCTSTKGRKHNSNKNDEWKLLSCSMCGSHARHKKCENLSTNETSWICSECVALEKEMRKSKIITRPKKLDALSKSRSNEKPSKVGANISPNCAAGPSIDDSDIVWKNKVENMVKKIAFLYSNPLLETYISSSISNREVDGNSDNSKNISPRKNNNGNVSKFKSLRKQQKFNKGTQIKLASEKKRKQIAKKYSELFERLKNDDDIMVYLQHRNPVLEELVNDITSYVSEIQDNFQQYQLNHPKIKEEIDSGEEIIAETAGKCYASSLRLKQSKTKLVVEHAENLNNFEECEKSTLVSKQKKFFPINVKDIFECSLQDKTVASQTLCNSKTVNLKRIKFQKVCFSPYCKSQDNQEEKRKKYIDYTGSVSYNCKFVQKKNCARLKNEAIKKNSIPSCSDFNKQPTARKTCSTKRSNIIIKLHKDPDVTDSQTCPNVQDLGGRDCKKIKICHLTPPSENSTVLSNLLSNSKIENKVVDIKASEEQDLTESCVPDTKPKIPILLKNKHRISQKLRSRNNRTRIFLSLRKKNQKPCSDDRCIRKLLGHECSSFRV